MPVFYGEAVLEQTPVPRTLSKSKWDILTRSAPERFTYVISCVTVSANETITVCVMFLIDGDVPGDFDKGFGVLLNVSLSFSCFCTVGSIAEHNYHLLLKTNTH
jgi:hypothetical protein